jgi:hypothetical protein
MQVHNTNRFYLCDLYFIGMNRDAMARRKHLLINRWAPCAKTPEKRTMLILTRTAAVRVSTSRHVATSRGCNFEPRPAHWSYRVRRRLKPELQTQRGLRQRVKCSEAIPETWQNSARPSYKRGQFCCSRRISRNCDRLTRGVSYR